MACTFKGCEIWDKVMPGSKTVFQFPQDSLVPQPGAPLLLPPSEAREQLNASVAFHSAWLLLFPEWKNIDQFPGKTTVGSCFEARLPEFIF